MSVNEMVTPQPHTGTRLPHIISPNFQTWMQGQREETRSTNQQMLVNNEHILQIICDKHPDEPFIAAQCG